MKLILLSVIASIALCLPPRIAAQHSIGVLGGLNIANIHVENENFENVQKFGVGAVLDLRLTRNLAILIEPMYLTMGAKQTLASSNFQGAGPVTLKFDQSALSIPVLLRLDILSDAFRPYVIAGPFVSFRLDSELGIETSVGTFAGDAKNITKGSDFGLAFGGGMSYAIGGVRIFVDGRYALGLVDVSTPGDVLVNVGNQIQPVQVGDVDATTRGIQIMAGVALPLGSD